MRLAHFLLPLALAACGGDHAPGLMEVERDDCVACHLDDYLGTTAPVHEGSFPQTCGDCHSTTGWRPAAAGIHPESAFPIASGPHDMACLDCHDPDLGPYVNGENTDCVGCHTGAHTRAKMDDKHNEEPGYAWDDANPHFCLECHPRGRAD